ncbi:MAG: hypothetical protein E7013_04965 [Alphaproteobacteria bacterium]|nr:hypothetical protein [Alphaproteobacteria bacterium]
MENLKVALEKLSNSIKELEDAVDFSIKKQNQHKDKIETLQIAIQTTYQKIDDALSKLEENQDNQEEEICLSSP